MVDYAHRKPLNRQVVDSLAHMFCSALDKVWYSCRWEDGSQVIFVRFYVETPFDIKNPYGTGSPECAKQFANAFIELWPCKIALVKELPCEVAIVCDEVVS